MLFYAINCSILRGNGDTATISPPPTDQVYAQGFVDGNVNGYADTFFDDGDNYRRLY